MSTLLTPEMQEIALTYMEGLQCPRSLTVALLIRSSEWAQLMKLACPPANYPNADAYRRAAAATGFFSKLDVAVPGLNPAEAAWDNWLAAEHACYKTNARLSPLLSLPRALCSEREGLALDFLAEVKKWVRWLIGNAPPSYFEGGFGPGATVSDGTGQTSVAHKLSSTLSLTSKAVYYLVPWTGTAWSKFHALHRPKPICVRGNRYFRVPKNAKTDRNCATEPSLNAFYQRGVGKVMSARLRRRGIRIDSPLDSSDADMKHKICNEVRATLATHRVAKDVHGQVARRGSLLDTFATIDLESASDTIAYSFVQAVLPYPWFQVLDDLRSPMTKVNGRWYHLEKFSSMGNGFTFELETTLFLAVCLAVCPWLQPGKDLLVFGDDIIVPRQDAQSVMKALSWCGFKTNTSKTFVSHDFKESCGNDYWRGEAVRPHYVKSLPEEPTDFIALANGIRRMAYQDANPSGLRVTLRRAWFRTLDQLPSHIRCCRGPVELGDVVVHDDEKHWLTRTRHQKCYIKIYRPIRPAGVNLNRFDRDTVLRAVLYGSKPLQRPKYERTGASFRGFFPIRGEVEGYKVSWSSFG